MANLRNEFEFRSALLTALGQEHTEAEAKNEEMWRRKMLDGLGVEYDQNDVNQFGLFREKLIEGVTSKSEGGGGVTWDTVFEGSVTTQDDDGDISGIIENLTLNGNSIRVTFNGTVYELPKTEHGYGAENESGLDFSTYPLFIATGEGADSCTLWTPTAGTYTLKIEEPQSGGSSDLVAVGIYNTYNTTVTLKYFEQQGATPVDYAIERKTGIALSVPKDSGFIVTSSQYKIGSKTADAFVIETEPFSSATVVNAGVLFLETITS